MFPLSKEKMTMGKITKNRSGSTTDMASFQFNGQGQLTSMLKLPQQKFLNMEEHDEDEDMSRFKNAHSSVDSLIADSVKQVVMRASTQIHNSVDRAENEMDNNFNGTSDFTSKVSGLGFSSGLLSPTKSYIMSNVYDRPPKPNKDIANLL